MKIFIEEQKFTQSWLFIGLAIGLIVVTMPIIKDWAHISQGSFLEMLNDLGGILIILLVFTLFIFFQAENQNRRKRCLLPIFAFSFFLSIFTLEFHFQVLRSEL